MTSWAKTRAWVPSISGDAVFGGIFVLQWPEQRHRIGSTSPQAHPEAPNADPHVGSMLHGRSARRACYTAHVGWCSAGKRVRNGPKRRRSCRTGVHARRPPFERRQRRRVHLPLLGREVERRRRLEPADVRAVTKLGLSVRSLPPADEGVRGERNWVS